MFSQLQAFFVGNITIVLLQTVLQSSEVSLARDNIIGLELVRAIEPGLELLPTGTRQVFSAHGAVFRSRASGMRRMSAIVALYIDETIF